VKQRSPGQQLEDAASLRGALARSSSHGHIVQFYDDDHVLVDNIARFVIAGVRCMQSIVIIGPSTWVSPRSWRVSSK